MRRTSPDVGPVGEHRVDVVSTRSSTVSHRNFRPAFFCSAPGSRPASVSTWKPLQMPTTGPPAAANSADRVHHRREAGDRAGAQVVAVREPAGHDDRVDAAARSRRRASSSSASPPSCSTAYDDVELAVRAREQHDADRASRRHGVDARRQLRDRRPSYASITGLARSRSHISSTCARAALGVGRVDDEPDGLADVHLATFV